MSGKRAKIELFSYIKQNSIAEIVPTMESFLNKIKNYDTIIL